MKILKELLEYRETISIKSSSIYHTTRYCNHKDFKLLVCGGYNRKTSMTCGHVSCIDVDNLENVEAYRPMITERDFFKVVHVKGNLYVFGGYNTHYKRVMSVDKYSLTSKTWSQVAEMYDSRRYFCICAFMDKVFVIGGFNDALKVKCSFCLEFDTNDYSWKKVAKMNEARLYAACAVYAERIVVSGGTANRNGLLKTVESYDVLPNRWSSMPNMNFAKCCHSLVSVKNKLFVISIKAENCEVYDNIGKIFITMKSPKLNYGVVYAFSIGNKIYVFHNESSKLICYDVDKNKWLEKSCGVTKNLLSFSSAKVPSLSENN